MAESGLTIGTIITIYQNAKMVIEFLNQLTDDSVMLKCDIPSSRNVKTVVFEAFDHRSLHVQMVNGVLPPPWAEDKCVHEETNPVKLVYSLFKTTPPPHDPEKGSTKFKTIEIRCDNEDQLQDVLLRFHGKSVNQREIVDYLKIVSRKYSKVTVKVDRTAYKSSKSDSPCCVQLELVKKNM